MLKPEYDQLLQLNFFARLDEETLSGCFDFGKCEHLTLCGGGSTSAVMQDSTKTAEKPCAMPRYPK